MATGKFVAYYRVSTERQGRSGLGLDAQRAMVDTYLNGGDWQVIAEFTDIESGGNDDRPQLTAAIHRAKMTGARLLIAKLDRLSRNVAFIATMQQSGVRFVCCDMPEANETMIGFMAVIAQHERKVISERTRAAFAAAKAQGRIFGNPNGAAPLRRAAKGNRDAVAAIRAGADQRARDVLPLIADIRAGGITTLLGIARELNHRGILTARGDGQWTATAVRRVLARV